jgi:hypothetical protein
MRPALAIAFSLILSVASAGSLARADDLGTDESRAGMCDDFGGLPFVFCVAMCEARECDRLDADDQRCEVLARGFATVTNGAAPPCPARSGRGTI